MIPSFGRAFRFIFVLGLLARIPHIRPWLSSGRCFCFSFVGVYMALLILRLTVQVLGGVQKSAKQRFGLCVQEVIAKANQYRISVIDVTCQRHLVASCCIGRYRSLKAKA